MPFSCPGCPGKFFTVFHFALTILVEKTVQSTVPCGFLGDLRPFETDRDNVATALDHVDVVRVCLHHHLAFLLELLAVVSLAVLVIRSMRQLPIHDLVPVAQPRLRCRPRYPMQRNAIKMAPLDAGFS